MSAPTIPPRPARSQNPLNTSAASTDVPQIPPRPSARRPDRSSSPHRDTFARSPLNEIPSAKPLHNGDHPYNHHLNPSDATLPRRPPSVSLPSIGQEGSEYANFDTPADDGGNGEGEIQAPSQQRNVAGDLPLHAPKASVSASTARSRIAPVTRTDSTQAAAAGIGKAHTQQVEKEREPRGLTPQTHHGRSGSSSLSTQRARSSGRADSAYAPDHEHGIPAIGQQVPMYPNAGDVQAPSPSPFGGYSTGVGYFNDSSQTDTNHGRRRSQIFTGPPGSYGLHGHGTVPRDALEKAWYERHPEALEREGHGEYTSTLSGNRGEAALTSEDLNKIVQQTANIGIGLGTSREAIGTPSEQIGYIASEEYSLRMTSPRFPPVHGFKKRTSSSHIESPLRKSFSLEGEDAQRLRDQHEHALESELEEDVIHIDPPARRHDKYGGGGYDPPTEDLGPHGGNSAAEGGWVDERGQGTPILASDEVAKSKGGEYMQPAISPEQEHRGTEYFAGVDSEAPPPYQTGHRSGSRSNSRPSSRPASIHGFSGLSKVLTHEDIEERHTPLENVQEYEPLFKDDEEEVKKDDKPMTAADRLKRPLLGQHRFPSQDIWEDTPDSLHLQTTVESPQLPEEETSPVTVRASSTFEPPEAEQARKGEASEADRTSFLDQHLAKSPFFKAHLRQEMGRRPGMAQRFPSRDIWEDTPDSLQLETTVEAPQVDSIIGSPQDTQSAIAAFAESKDKAGSTGKPVVPRRPPKSKASEEAEHDAPTDVSLPSKGPSSKETSPTERKAPTIPERPKPQIPPRPARPSQDRGEEANTLTKELSPSSAGSDTASAPAPAPKVKPMVPARPEGKLAALKAGFMNDLNSRLKLGPQAPPKVQERSKETEPQQEDDKAPLSDARKGRARGPQRRRPAAEAGDALAPKGEAATSGAYVRKNWAVKAAWTVWSISDDGHVDVPGSPSSSSVSAQPAAAPKAEVDSTPTPPTSAAADETLDERGETEEAQEASNAVVAPTGDSDPPASQSPPGDEEAKDKENAKPVLEKITDFVSSVGGLLGTQPQSPSETGKATGHVEEPQQRHDSDNDNELVTASARKEEDEGGVSLGGA